MNLLTILSLIAVTATVTQSEVKPSGSLNISTSMLDYVSRSQLYNALKAHGITAQFISGGVSATYRVSNCAQDAKEVLDRIAPIDRFDICYKGRTSGHLKLKWTPFVSLADPDRLRLSADNRRALRCVLKGSSVKEPGSYARFAVRPFLASPKKVERAIEVQIKSLGQTDNLEFIPSKNEAFW